MTNQMQDLAKRGVDGAIAQNAAALAPDVVASLVLTGDLSKLSDSQKVAYYNTLCARIGLDPATQPFKLLRLDGKLVMYADKGATQQLSDIHQISHQITNKQTVGDVYCVTVRATMLDGRYTDEDGIVSLTDIRDGKEYTLKGKGLANAMMRATTKAKRRAVLALLGLAMMDEAELDNVKGEPVALPPIAPPVRQLDAPAVAEPDTKSPPVQPAAIPWIETATHALAACIRAGEQKNAQEWGIEAKKRADAGEITRAQFEELRVMYYKAWPPKPQPEPGLFDDQGKPKPEEKKYPTPEQRAKQDEANAERNELAQTPPVDPYEEEEKEKKAKKDTKKKRGHDVDIFADLTGKIADATKASILFTLKSRVDKADVTEGQRGQLYMALDAKLKQVKGAKK